MKRRPRPAHLTLRPESLNLPGVRSYVEMGTCPLHGRVIMPCVACRTLEHMAAGLVKRRPDRVRPRLLADMSPNPRYRPEAESTLDLAEREDANYRQFWEHQSVAPPCFEPEDQQPVAVAAQEGWFVGGDDEAD